MNSTLFVIIILINALVLGAVIAFAAYHAREHFSKKSKKTTAKTYLPVLPHDVRQRILEEAELIVSKAFALFQGGNEWLREPVRHIVDQQREPAEVLTSALEYSAVGAQENDPYPTYSPYSLMLIISQDGPRRRWVKLMTSRESL